MQETNLSEPLDNSEFYKMEASEKAIVKAYKNHLLKDTPVFKIRELMIAVNKIHERYPDFDMSQVP